MTAISYHRFYRDSEGWFIDLPEYIEQGLGTKANLAMVSGADTLLDILSNGQAEVFVRMDREPFGGAEELVKTSQGMNETDEFGAYYRAVERRHDLWLCPVTLYVFDGLYPDKIYISATQTEDKG
jgi:hypothetical protein